MELSRRRILAMGGALALAPSVALASQRGRRRVLRFVHLTDIHVQPERGAPEGMEAALQAALKHKPDFVLTGGDNIMDSFAKNEARTKAQWDLYQSVLAGVKTPVRHILGNHDVWGWNKSASETTGNEPKWGKRWALEVYERDIPHFAFEQAGWKLIVLDSTFPRGDGYVARLDDEQFEWLQGELAGTRMPTLLLSHMPLLSPSAYLDGDNEKTGNWIVPGAWMHIDFRRIKDELHKWPHVKGALSGHIHLVDRADYLGVQYHCNGAVSGSWWGGSYQEFGPAFAIVDCFSDGSFECRMEELPWKARP